MVSGLISSNYSKQSQYHLCHLVCIFSGEDWHKSEEEKLIIPDSINIRPWSLTPGATQYLKSVIARSLFSYLECSFGCL